MRLGFLGLLTIVAVVSCFPVIEMLESILAVRGSLYNPTNKCKGADEIDNVGHHDISHDEDEKGQITRHKEDIGPRPHMGGHRFSEGLMKSEGGKSKGHRGVKGEKHHKGPKKNKDKKAHKKAKKAKQHGQFQEKVISLDDLSNQGSEYSDDEYSIENYKSLPEIDTNALQRLLNTHGLKKRAGSLFNIARRSAKKYGHPTRVIGSPGHWATINYIKHELYKLKGYYNVSTQRFNAVEGRVRNFFLEINNKTLQTAQPVKLTPPTPNKEPLSANLVLVNNFGCSKDDFPESSASKIALVKRGECPFSDKSINAGNAGAVGAIVYDKEELKGTFGPLTGKEVPSLTIKDTEVQEYIDVLEKDPLTEIKATVLIDSYVKNTSTLNVVAETVHGDHNNVVALGAHSDSVEEGPGINDDGSGLISLLEVAKYLARFKVNNAVRFAWWAAEEEGLIGSSHYANSLSPEENKKLRLFMDYDMMASPNYEYEVYDADNESNPNGSGNLKDLYVDWYNKNGLNYTFVPFDGRSDYVGFIENGIPAGGIATGAEKIKSPSDQEKYGGIPNQSFDYCYHQLCDNLGNPNYDAWLTNTKLIAHSVAVYPKSFEGFPARESATAASKPNQFVYRGAYAIM